MKRKEIVFLSGARTPIGSYGKTLKDFTATELGTVAAKGALARSGVSPEDIDHVVFGNVMQTSEDAAYLARHVGLNAGVPIATPALTVNRLCASGFQAVIEGAYQLLLGEADFVLVGGAESMSRAPHAMYGARWGFNLGEGKLVDTLAAGLTDARCGCGMGITAENLGRKYGVTREESDHFACQSQQRAKEAAASGRLAEEIVPVIVKGRKGEETPFQVDEHPRPDVTLEKLAALAPVFDEEGIVTPGNSSGINDAGAALVMTTAEAAKERGLSPMGRLISWGVSGVEPEIMGIGPVPASGIALDRAGLKLDDMEIIEVNEAFAAQYVAVEKEMGLDRSIVNVNGGAIALGHPVGATGARLTVTLLKELSLTGKKLGLATACVGGGQGVALVLGAAESA
ncbi:MAG: acetyl-CoA C-acetyltransferase [Nitrospinota bacterium]|nr:acetyl-CoA C-acetyltransferase [Nitrospinota bacterium]